MATAGAKTRRNEEEARSQDASSAETSQKSGKSRRGGTRQLDFFQAMADFRTMFPTLEDEVIEAVLRANDGAVDATIDQLLTMTIDMDVTESVATSEAALPLEAYCPQYEEKDKPSTPGTEDSPPSYSEAMRSQSHTDQAQSIWTTPIGQPSVPTKSIHELDVDSFSRALSNTEPKGAMAQLSPQRLPANSGLGFSPQRNDTHSGGFFGAAHQNSASDQGIHNTRRKKEFRNWNPPMLGNLPDDFLRLIPPDTQSGSPSAKSERTTNLSTTPINVLSLTDVKPKIHKSRSKSEKMSRPFGGSPKDVKEKDSKSRSSDKKSKSSDKMSRSLSMNEESPETRGHKASRSQSARLKDRGSRHRDMNSSLSPSHHSVIIETHDFSKDMLDERMKENERRRNRTSAEFDPEMAQYLEDERMAIALQNSEFLQELRGNEDFMKTLQREQLNTPTFETPVPEPSPRPPDNIHEGYGDDGDKTLGAFPFSQQITKDKDEDAELRKQLSGMGRASRKQLASLARKFFRRKKKSSKQILGEKLAPSMMNLLEDEDEDDDDDLHVDSRYGNSPPEIEPLPSTLIGVPNHHTVQRLPYQPGGVTTYFDNKHVDIV